MSKKAPTVFDVQPIVSALGCGNAVLGELLARKALKKHPRNPEVLHLCGVACLMKGKAEQAQQLILSALMLRSTDGAYWLNLALARQQLGNEDDAGTAFRQCLLLQPDNPQAANNLGNILKLQARFAEAEALYRQAIDKNPAYSLAYLSLGNLLCDLRRSEEAIQILQQAVARFPNSAPIGGALGQALENRKRFVEAAREYKRAHQWNGLQRMLRTLCDWSELATVDEALLKRFNQDSQYHPSPWGLIVLPGLSPRLHLEAGRRYAEHFWGKYLTRTPLAQEPVQEGRLRIGYLSCDFYDHATLHLLMGVLERHDPARVDVQLFDISPVRDDVYTCRLAATGLPRHDLRELSDEVAAQLIAGQRLHILVDLKGFTTGARLGISARRPAPVIVSWLGYPGSLGHPGLADYLLGDPVVTPPEHAGHYSETLALLPDCYQPNDRHRAQGKLDSRRDAGLPQTGLVFCSFNQLLKLNPRQLDLWCRLLREVPGSLLWLLDPEDDSARTNVIAEVHRRSISAERLIFAPRLRQDLHLARLGLADIALDSFPCTSHTTASDVLWAGVPLLTRSGDTFASRVAASLLHTHGFDDLVAVDDEDYVAKVRTLANSAERLAQLRQRLERARLSSPLFDTVAFTRNLETLFDAIWRHHQHAPGNREPVKAAVFPSEPPAKE